MALPCILLTKLNLSSNTKQAIYRTRLNGKILKDDTFDSIVSKTHSHFENGLYLNWDEKKELFKLTSYTVENKKHVLNFNAFINRDAKVIDGLVNCFTLGFMDIEQEYVNELFEELEDCPIEWDVIKLNE